MPCENDLSFLEDERKIGLGENNGDNVLIIIEYYYRLTIELFINI